MVFIDLEVTFILSRKGYYSVAFIYRVVFSRSWPLIYLFVYRITGLTPCDVFYVYDIVLYIFIFIIGPTPQVWVDNTSVISIQLY